MHLSLEIISGKELYVSSYTFDKSNGYIGRTKKSDFILEDESLYISSKHALIEYKNDFYYITDISTNGTYIKNPYKKIPKDIPIKINNLDIFIIGDYELKAILIDDNDINISQYSDLKVNSSKLLIPDDDFLFENSSIMKNSFLQEESFESLNNSILDDYNKEENSILNILSNTNSIEIKEDNDVEETANKLNEHIEEKIINLDFYNNNIEGTIETEIVDTAQSSEAIEILENRLGIDISLFNKQEQERIINEIANIVLSSLKFLKSSLDMKDEIISDSTFRVTSPSDKELNPIKQGVNESLKTLVNPMDSIIPLSKYIEKSFIEIDNHNIAISKSYTALIPTLIDEFNSKKLENTFKNNYKFKLFIPKRVQFWDAYIANYNKNIENMSSALTDSLSKEYKRQTENLKKISL
ncbi:FHA domain protein [Aliarcobacter thereius]|uniref:FHA domain protein n=1 Tax=Aliarcobacter thereius TaxID=544718 RepID=A0A1C0B336_9BACT|nr:type VI secretion system-associated FHA domain protein TagH [Aliarcobacter thereius]OCL96683.1 FHA domain protein [Aliarcobacter thereius]